MISSPPDSRFSLCRRPFAGRRRAWELRRLGYKVSYEENAIAWTEAPDTWRALGKQRFRWSFGTLQCMWKHRDALLRPRFGTLGLIAMPNVWIFQILFPLISPVMDLMLVWTLFSAALQRVEHPAEYVATNLLQVLFYYGLFVARSRRQLREATPL